MSRIFKKKGRKRKKAIPCLACGKICSLTKDRDKCCLCNWQYPDVYDSDPNQKDFCKVCKARIEPIPTEKPTKVSMEEKMETLETVKALTDNLKTYSVKEDEFKQLISIVNRLATKNKELETRIKKLEGKK